MAAPIIAPAPSSTKCFLDLAFESFRALILPAAPQLFDPIDHVVENYGPMSNDIWYALNCNLAGALATCAESVQVLAMWLVWAEENASKPVKERKEAPRMLESAAPNGLTVMQMVRRLQRIHLLHFPIYEYEVAGDHYNLLSGREREDGMAIVFVPVDLPNGFPVAHWTFGPVVGHVEPAIRNSLPTATTRYIIFSRLPIVEPGVFWRAEVNKENQEEYSRQYSLGLACDCDWRLRCEHEVRHVPALVGWNSVRITIDGARHVYGSQRGVIVRSYGPAIHRVSETALSVCMGGKQHVFEGMSVDLALRARSPFYGLTNWRSPNRYLNQTQVGVFDIGVYSVDCRTICNEDALFKMKLPSLHTMWVATMAATDRETLGRVVHLEWDVPDRPWAETEGLNLSLPRKTELLNRLALRNELSEDTVLDTVRRMAAEERWSIDVDRAEMRVWLKRVMTEVGKANMIPKPSAVQCWNCCKIKKTYRHMCKACRNESKVMAPERFPLADVQVAYVGFRPLWSVEFELPAFKLKPDVVIEFAKSKKVLYDGDHPNLYDLLGYLKARAEPTSCRGYLRGPMFLSQEPTCFPRGDANAVRAFLVRLGSERLHEAKDWFYGLCFAVVRHRLSVIEPETWAYFLSHFHGEKRVKNEEARRDECEGWSQQTDVSGELKVPMKGFVKAEKGAAYELDSLGYVQVEKKTLKPRFICSPDPIVLARLGRWTHAQTKWLAREYHYKKNVFYAGCASPIELNEWLDMSLRSIPEPWTLVDDITAIDANHSEQSFRFHRRVRKIQFPHMDAWTAAAFVGEEKIRVRVGNYKCTVSDVNASGVSDTSYKNSLICIVVRSLAVLHGFMSIEAMSVVEVKEKLRLLERVIFATASGDDGLVRLPEVVLGVHISNFSMDRYRQVWSWAGFSVKASMIPPNRWRMATYLAMRPVWSGVRYEWAPEPARRMRGMFWQIDNAMHPVAWARGIATQILGCAKTVPVLSHVCHWFLQQTDGPVAQVEAINRYSPFSPLTCSGEYNDRAVREFCLDYHVTRDDIGRFERMLADVGGVLVNLDCHALRRIFAEES